MDRPITTLFMLESLDGKISSGSDDSLDVDNDWCNIQGVKEGLQQYYDIEQTTDLYSLNTGRVMAKIGVNARKEMPNKSPVSFIIIDNKPHLDATGIDYLCHWAKNLFLVTINPNHIVFQLKEQYPNLTILQYSSLNPQKFFQDLYENYQIKNLTIQSGGNFNALLLRAGLIDYVHVVIAPLLVGGTETSTLIDGKSITTINDLHQLKPLELIKCTQLQNSYIELKYRVLNKSTQLNKS